MKAPRLVLVLLLMVLTVLSAGCEPKIYYFDFEEEGDLTNDEGSWVMMQAGGYSFGSYGVVLNGSHIFTPHKYRGDMTITCQFAVDMGSEASGIVFFLSPEPFIITDPHDDYVMLVCNIPSSDEAILAATEKGSGEERMLYNAALLGLFMHATNTMRIILKGNTISVELNEETMFTRTLEKYDSSWSCVSMLAFTPSMSIWVRNFRIEYWGSREIV